MSLQITALVVSLFSLALSLFALVNALKMAKEFDQNAVKAIKDYDLAKTQKRRDAQISLIRESQS